MPWVALLFTTLSEFIRRLFSQDCYTTLEGGSEVIVGDNIKEEGGVQIIKLSVP